MSPPMYREMKLWVVVIALSLVSNTQLQSFCVKAEQKVPCFFIFGDSLADPGNNNRLSTLAKVNYAPYGIDFPNGPTGRFTNGRTMVDILGQLLGFRHFIPPFASARGTSDILDGVNYASGSAGILDKTGKHLGENIGFAEQLRNHRIIISQMGDTLQNKELTWRHLTKCLYWVGLGSNDYLNNYYYFKHYKSSRKYTPEKFASVLIEQYRSRILRLYDYGARKVVLSGIGRIGCIPRTIALYRKNKSAACADQINHAVEFFNVKLLTLVDQLNSNLTDAKFVYINNYGMGGGDPSAIGFKNWTVGCCPVNEVGQCIHSSKPCKNRNEYVFWDSFHPGEIINKITAGRIYNAFDLTDSYPMDVSQLVQMSASSSF